MSSYALPLAAGRVQQRQVWALRLLPVLAALGPTFLFFEIAGAGLFPFRVAVAIVLLLTLGSSTHWRRRPLAMLFLEVVLLWTLWAGASLTWAPDINLGIEQTIAIAFGLVVAVAMFNLGIHRDTHLDALAEGWMLAYVVTGAFAVRELVTGEYLPGQAIDYYREFNADDVAISTFGNPNNYAAFLLLAVPFMFLGYTRAPTRQKRLIALALLVSVPVLVFFTTSRIALIGIVAQYLVFAAIGFETTRGRLRFLLIGALVVTFMGTVFWAGSRTAADFVATIDRDEGIVSSDEARLNLTRNGIWMTYTSGGFGVGAAGFAATITEGEAPYYVGNLSDPHNFWIEVLAQYGFVVFLALLLWFARVTRVGLKARRWSKMGANPVAKLASITVVIGLTGYLFASVANSHFIAQSTNWVFLAGIGAMAANLEHTRWQIEPGRYGRRASLTYSEIKEKSGGEGDPGG